MRALLTNDDGILAPGLTALWAGLREVAEVTVVAPDTELSGTGHAISMRKPVMCHRAEREDDFRGYSLEGTPADCVKVGLTELQEGGTDLVVAGINLGANTGIHVLYSGTVAAALEGAMAGICSVAVSLVWSHEPDYAGAARVAVPLIERILALADSRGTVFNINIPPETGLVRGVRLARQSRIAIADRYVRRQDPRGRMYFWIEGDGNADKSEPDSDRAALAEGFVTVTPLSFDLTDERLMSSLSRLTWTGSEERGESRVADSQQAG